MEQTTLGDFAPRDGSADKHEIANEIASNPYDPARDRENTRPSIAMRLVWTLVVLVGGTFLLAAASVIMCSGSACNASSAALEPVKALVQLLLTPLVGLVGAVTGFYFGKQSSRNAKS